MHLIILKQITQTTVWSHQSSIMKCMTYTQKYILKRNGARGKTQSVYRNKTITANKEKPCSQGMLDFTAFEDGDLLVVFPAR